MVWYYINKWLKEIVDVERPNEKVYYERMDLDLDVNWWNRMWRWWKEYDLPMYEKKMKWV